jgi:hypothetical protein
VNVLKEIWREAWQPPDRRPAWQWCEDHIEGIPYSPNPGRFRSENSPWIREVMESLVDPRICLGSVIQDHCTGTHPLLPCCFTPTRRGYGKGFLALPLNALTPVPFIGTGVRADVVMMKAW